MLLNILLLLIITICIITDLHNRKIYNIVIFPGLAIAFELHLVFGGWTAVLQAFWGLLIGFGLLLLPYLLGGMGAGDVKLLALIGAIKGVSFVFYTALYMSVIGAVIALFVLLCRKGVFNQLQSCFFFIYGIRYGIKLPLHFQGLSYTATYPYGIAIAGGALFSLAVREMMLF